MVRFAFWVTLPAAIEKLPFTCVIPFNVVAPAVFVKLPFIVTAELNIAVLELVKVKPVKGVLPTMPLTVIFPLAPAFKVSTCAPLMVEEKLMFWPEAPPVVMTTALFS